MKKTLLLLFLCLLGYTSILAQDNGTWSYAKEVNPKMVKNIRNYKAYQLNSNNLKKELSNTADRKGLAGGKTRGKIIAFPTGNGSLEKFRVYESAVLSAGLQLKYPHIKSYYGVSTTNKGKTIRISLDDFGFHALVRSEKGISYINPVASEKDLYYIAPKSDFKAPMFQCKTGDEVATQQLKGMVGNREDIVNDGSLRTYRIAIASTGEYSDYHINAAGVSDGTDQEKKSAVLSAMNTTITRVNEIFERDLAVTLEIVADNDKIIYLDADTDPFTNDDGDTLLDEIQSVTDSNIGTENYDIGHVFSTGGGGIAEVASVCTTTKARGVTGSSSPVGDPFDIDFVAHELGHQFGASHTFNNSCNSNRSDNTAVEPGSGTTIMAYAGICPPNVQGASDPYFHAVSIAQIWSNITDGINDCAAVQAIGNNAPVLDPLNSYTIPKGTAFYLEGTASDPDGDELTYSWEQIDNSIVTQPPAPDANEGPAFRVYPPDTSPKRYFPSTSAILSNNLSPQWEVVSNAGRDYNFALLVRDNNVNGGQTAREDTKVTADENSGPFTVTSQTDNTTITGGDAINITWDVANTNIAPINASSVDIFLIIDGDFETLIPLISDTPNDGEENVVLPGNITTSNARIMVQPTNNIFFAVNTASLQIQQSEFVLDFNALSYEECQPNDVIFSFTYNTFAGFNETTNFTASNVPSGLNVDFSNTSATSNGTSIDVTVSGTGNPSKGKHSFTINANASSISKEYPIEIHLYDNTFDNIPLNSPSDGTLEVLTDRKFEWTAIDNTISYEIQYSELEDFSSITETSVVNEPHYIPANLQPGTTYYWRVKPINDCGSGNFSNSFSFSTITLDCLNEINNTPININNQQPSTITSEINITNNGFISDISVDLNITHTYISDLTVSLTSPSGTEITLINEICGNGRNINATFSANGTNIICGTNPSISGLVAPDQALENMVGEPAAGTWTLTVSDAYSLDGGTLNSFGLNICTREDSDQDGIFDPLDECPDTPPNTKVDTKGCPVFSVAANNYTIKTISESCISNNDGSININTVENHNYIATLTGSGGSNSLNFNNGTAFNNLSSGTYQLCFTVEGQPEYEQCFNLTIKQPESLSVLSKVLAEEKLLTLRLDGASLYNIDINGITTQTTENEISLPLVKGYNIIKVYSNKDCQGLYEENVFVPGKVVAHPNPFSHQITLFTGSSNQQTDIMISSLGGNSVYRASRKSDSKGNIPLDLSRLSTGIYLVTLRGEEIITTLKIVKE